MEECIGKKKGVRYHGELSLFAFSSGYSSAYATPSYDNFILYKKSKVLSNIGKCQRQQRNGQIRKEKAYIYKKAALSFQ